ncbi:MAG: type VI secretion system tip protein TssI/VgrG [Phycisphaerae bacterium]
MPETTRRSASLADYTLQIGDLTTDDLRVTAFSGEEGISELFSFQVELCSPGEPISVDAVIGKPCLLEIAGNEGSRFVNGIVWRFERTGQARRFTYYSVQIVPVHWLLTKRQSCRIFQAHNCSDMTVPGIMKKVFELAGIPEERQRFALTGSYTAREYVVQYRETDMDFISRLMEEEGIFFFYEHAVDGHKMVVADSPSAHKPAGVHGEAAFRDASGLVGETPTLGALRDVAEIQVGATRLTDFDFKRPGEHPSGTATGEDPTGLEYSDYPGGFLERSSGTTLAQTRLDEQACRRRVTLMSGATYGLAPGFKFTLIDHPDSAFNRSYLITHAAQRGTQPQSAEEDSFGEAGGYAIEIRTIPAETPFRPPRVTRRPRIVGSQTAIVVGPSGEEIYTDKYGRVKVQFHWDLQGVYDENSSCWIRVSQSAAGGQYGMMFLPRVGQEVVVDFLEGDPDRPLITGRVYNNDQMPAYTLPDNKTRSYIKTNSSKGGGGTNEIMFEDLKDSEKVLIFAQKDLHLRVTNDKVENVDHNRHVTVKEQSFELVKQKKHSEIKLDLNEKIGGKHSHETTGDYGLKVGGNHSNETSQNLYLKGGQNVVIESGMGLTLKVGGNFIKIDASGISIQGTLTKINAGGAAGSGSPVSLVAPDATIEADTATPGADTTYNAQAITPEALQVESKAFQAAQPPEAVEKLESWVEIEMIDEEGQPWRGEYYEITRPDGKVVKGYLNQQGQAHVWLPKNEQVQVSFPKLDGRAWVRA